MRLLHTSDWHLGRLFHGASLLDEQAAAMDRIVALAAEPVAIGHSAPLALAAQHAIEKAPPLFCTKGPVPQEGEQRSKVPHILQWCPTDTPPVCAAQRERHDPAARRDGDVREHEEGGSRFTEG